MPKDSFSEISKSDVYSLMMLLLFASDDNPRYSAINELAYLLDHDSFLNFIKFYEGQTIKIPPIEDLRNSLRTLMLYQYSKIDKMEWHDALQKAGFDLEDTFSAKRRLAKFVEYIDKHNFKLGGNLK